MQRWLSLPALAGAEPLDEAIALVRTAHPVLAARQAVLRQTEQQKSWKAQVRFGYAQSQMLETAAGPNASFTVSIPLSDRSRDFKLAAAKTEMAKEEDAVLARFLAEVAALKEHAGRVGELLCLLDEA